VTGNTSEGAEQSSQHRLPGDYFRVPGSARIWNYWMGGKDNYPVDRSAGDAMFEIYPDIVTIAKESRQFLIRAVRVLAGSGLQATGAAQLPVQAAQRRAAGRVLRRPGHAGSRSGADHPVAAQPRTDRRNSAG
jgi:hypothetical protein